MTSHRHILFILATLALLVSPLALAPVAAQTATVTFFVDTTADNDTPGGCTDSISGDCSLRQAIVAANTYSPSTDTKIISFQYYTDGPLSNIGAQFRLDSLKLALPAITADNVEVLANTDFGIPLIELNGNGRGDVSAVGLQLAGSKGLISGLSIYGFTNNGLEPYLGSGIYITGNNNHVVFCWIGIAPNGSTPTGLQNFSGIRIDGGATGNVIGGPGGETVANFISGNSQNGIIIRNSSGNYIQNNFIGLTRVNRATSASLLGNGRYGIQIVSVGGTSANNVIGGTNVGLSNIIGGNGEAGILLRDTGTTSTTIQSNYIGVDKRTSTDFGNTGEGVLLENGTSGNILGGTPTAPLIISGNSSYGVHLRTNGAVTRNNIINATTFVGVGTDGATALPNDLGGILIANGVTGTLIEGDTNNLRIAGNTGPGITVLGPSTSGTTISKALVGIIPTIGNNNPSRNLPNTGGGILIDQASSTNVADNTISGNNLFGVRLNRAQATNLSGNFIGVDLARTGAIPNFGSGIESIDGTNTVVSTNVISGNTQTGLLLRGSANTSIMANSITGNSAGGLLAETVGVTLTTGTQIYTNTISGNNLFGLRLNGVLTTTLRQNYVGLNLDHTAAQANLGNGVEVINSRNTSAEGTYVAGNKGAGIVITGTGSFSTTFRSTVAGLVNQGNGYVVGASNTGSPVQVTNGPQQTLIEGGTLGGAPTAPAGVLIEGTNTQTVTVSGLRIGWVPAPTADDPAFIAQYPFATGVTVNGPVKNVQILTNTIRYNTGAGVFVSGNADRVRIADNRLSRNGAGITLNGTTRLTTRPPVSDDPSASQNNPNHDIDPPPVDVTTFTDPLRLHVSDTGLIEGYVFTSTARTEAGLNPVSACITCTIQVFQPGPGDEATSGQGYETWLTAADISGGASSGSFSVPTNGHFIRQLVGGLGSATELLLIATDVFGNSSEYATFPISSSFSLSNLTPPSSALPGDVVTFTLRLTNTGTVDLQGLKLENLGTPSDWGIVTNPPMATVFPTLQPNSSRLVTVTLTLPKATSPNARASYNNLTTLTLTSGSAFSQSVVLDTTVLTRPLLSVTPTSSLGSAKPTETFTHTHLFRNDGNIPLTLNLAQTTLYNPTVTGPWTVTPSFRTVTLEPNAEARLNVNVTVPANAPVLMPNGDPVQAVTSMTVTVPLAPSDGPGPLTTFFSDTTRVDLVPGASITTEGKSILEGKPGDVFTFTHKIENLSNKATKFCLVSSVNLQSKVTYSSLTDGFVIDSNGCFTLDTVTDVQAKRFREARFEARVLVDKLVAPGSTELLKLTVREETTKTVLNSALVNDQINILKTTPPIIVQNQRKVWLPLVSR